MTEAPEALVLAGQLNETIRGRRITEVVAGYTPHKFTWFYGDPERYPAMLSGRTVGRAHAWGGLVGIEAGGATLVLCDGVNLTWHAPGAALPAKHQLLLGFDDESCVTVSVRMYGGIFCMPPDAVEFGYTPYYEAARNKPQVLSDDFTEEYFMTLADGAGTDKKSAKALLTTARTIPGLGNGVLQDILYNARINPKTRIGKLDEAARRELYASIVHTLRGMLACSGRDSESDLYGRRGGYAPYLSKDTAGHACTLCGATIVKENYLGGSIYYCPGCQPVLR